MTFFTVDLYEDPTYLMGYKEEVTIILEPAGYLIASCLPSIFALLKSLMQKIIGSE